MKNGVEEGKEKEGRDRKCGEVCLFGFMGYSSDIKMRCFRPAVHIKLGFRRALS